MTYWAGYADGYGGFSVAASGGGARRTGRWYRYAADGRVRFIQTGRTREIGLSDWEPISPLVRFQAGEQQELEDAMWPVLTGTFAGESAADLRAISTSLLWEFETV